MKVLSFVIGTAMVVAGIATGNVQFIIAGASVLFSATVQLLTASGAPARQASEQQIQLGEVPRMAMFGEASTDGSLVDAFNFGGKNKTDWEVLVIALADHRCHSLTGFIVNDKYVAFGGDGTVSGYNSQLQVFFRDGQWDQSVPTILTANSTGWTADDRGRGVAYVVVAYKADAEGAKSPVWPGGRPRFKWIVKGALCYDSRLDDTAGGEGDHRRDDPDTWEWSDNPIVCRYAYARGIYAGDLVDEPGMLLIGRGLSAAEAPPENAIWRANLCDELVGGDKRYRVDGPVYANQAFIEAEEMFAAATAGSVVTREGSVEINPGQARSVVATITDDDLLIGERVEWNNGILGEADGEWVNTVIARYVEPTQKWADHGAPVRRDVADIVADGGPREASMTLRLVKRAKQAGELAEMARRRGRLWGRGKVVLGPRFVGLEEDEWIEWTSARRFGGETRTFVVDSYVTDEQWKMRPVLKEISADVFGPADGIAGGSVAEQQDPPVKGAAPDPGSWTLTAVQLGTATGQIPALCIEGATDDDDYASLVCFEYWPDDGVTDPEDVTDWIETMLAAPSVTRRDIVSVAAGQDYYAAVSYFRAGERGDRLILGPVTAGEVGTRRGAYQFIGWTGNPLTSNDNSITIAAFDGTLDDGREVSLPSGSVTSLTSGTMYAVFRDPVAGTYSAAPSPALTEMGSAALIFVGAQTTSTSGSFPPPPPPPPGYGGGGPKWEP